MIKPEELRKNNYVTCFSTQPDKAEEPIHVNYIAPTEDGEMAVYFDDGWCVLELTDPVELTEDMLIMLGCTWDGGWLQIQLNARIIIRFSDGDCNKCDIVQDGINIGLPMCRLRYVHRFQNLVHALTGKELTFK